MFYLKYCLSYLENHVLPSGKDFCGVQTLKYPNWHWWDFLLVKPLGKIIWPKRRHQFLVTASFPHLCESCLKFRKGRGYIKSIYLVKLTVKPALSLLLPNYFITIRKNHIELGSKSTIHFQAGIIVFWKLLILLQFCRSMKHETKHYSILLMIPLTFDT